FFLSLPPSRNLSRVLLVYEFASVAWIVSWSESHFDKIQSFCGRRFIAPLSNRIHRRLNKQGMTAHNFHGLDPSVSRDQNVKLHYAANTHTARQGGIVGGNPDFELAGRFLLSENG